MKKIDPLFDASKFGLWEREGKWFDADEKKRIEKNEKARMKRLAEKTQKVLELEPDIPEFDENCLSECKPGEHVCGK